MRGFARGLALKKRHKTIRKWPIVATSAQKKAFENVCLVADTIYGEKLFEILIFQETKKWSM